MLLLHFKLSSGRSGMKLARTIKVGKGRGAAEGGRVSRQREQLEAGPEEKRTW